MLGYDYYRFEQQAVAFFGGTVPPLDIYNPDHIRVDYSAYTAPTNFNYARNQEWYGLYFQDQLKLTEQVHFLFGGRHDWAMYENGYSPESIAAAEQGFRKSRVNTGRFNPRLGLVYQPWPWLSFYANYVESLGANNGRTGDGSPLQPQTARQYEGGLKTEFFDGRLTSTLAFYHIVKEHIPTPDPDPLKAAQGISRTIGAARSQGIELDVTGQITEQFSLVANYAFTDTEVTSDNSGNEGNRLPNAPEHSVNLWGNYRFDQGFLNGLNIGTGVYVVSQRQGDVQNSFQLPGYARWDAAVGYQWKVGDSRLTTRLNVYNLLDKRYYESSNTVDGGPRYSIFPGAPLTFLGSVQFEY